MEFFAEDELVSIVPNFSLAMADRSTLTCLTVWPPSNSPEYVFNINSRERRQVKEDLYLWHS